MSSLRLLTCATLLACALPAIAQNAIERQMTPAEFKAAGLHKLDAAELARLNAWLNRTIDTETSRAAVQAKKQVEDDNRGFFNFGSTEPVVARIDGEFRGFAKGRQYSLDNGQLWRQLDDASLAGVRKVAPQVKITPGLVGDSWYMAIDGYNTRAKVQRIK